MGSLPLTPYERRQVAQFVCDGVPRFTVGQSEGLTYSQAYEKILTDEDGSFSDDGKITFTPKAMSRIRNLNVRYINIAHKFLREQMKQPATKPAAQQNHD